MRDVPREKRVGIVESAEPSARVLAAHNGDIRDLTGVMYSAFQKQWAGARHRGVSFEFDFSEWATWWLTDDRWLNRGTRRGQFVMCRVGDVGPYNGLNVYCGTTRENARDASNSKMRERRAFFAKHGALHLLK